MKDGMRETYRDWTLREMKEKERGIKNLEIEGETVKGGIEQLYFFFQFFYSTTI